MDTTAPTPESLLAHRRWIEDLARRLVRDPHAAADVAQQAWVHVLDRPPGPLRSARAWLATVVRNCARDRFRRDGRRATREEAVARPEASPAPPAVDLVARAEAQRAVLDAVLALDEPYRTTVLLRWFEHLEPAAIAERLGEPAGTVRSRLHRAHAQLRDRLDRHHDGDRGAWAVALLGPRAWPPPPSAAAAPVPVSATLKGALLMTTNAKIATGAAAVVLLLLGWTLAGGDPAAPGDSAGAGSVHETGSLPPPPEPAPLPAGDTDDADDGTGAAAAVAAGEDAGATGEKPGPLEFALLPPPAPEVPETTDAPAPTRAPRTWTQAELEEAGITIGGTGGGFQPGRMGPVPGKRSKWAPVPEKGTVTVRGRVVDLQGRPLAGAEVLRLEPAAGGAEGDVVSFAHIRTAGTAGADGRFELREQPARAWRLGGNWHRSQNRDRGYAVPRTVSMEPAEHDVVEGVEIVVPVDASRVGALHGRVTDDTGRPLRNVRVFAGFTEARSKRDGTWALPVVAAGDVLVRVGKFGYEEFARTVPLAPGQDVAVAIELVRRNAGSLAVEGRVVDETGAPVADFPVWLGGHLHLSRDGRTDAAGRFRFKGLADRLAGKTVVVSTMGNPDEAGILNTTRKDVPVSGEPVTITVVRTTRCRIHMLDALSEEPQTLIRMTVEREVDGAGGPELKSFRSMSVHDEDGVIEIALPRGRVVLTIETPDHAVVRGEFTVPGVDHEHDVRVLMPPR